VLREQLPDKRLRFTDAQRRRLATKGKAVGRKKLRELGAIVTPDTRYILEVPCSAFSGVKYQ